METHPKSPDHAADCRCLLCSDHEHIAFKIGDNIYVEHAGRSLELLVTDVSPVERLGDLIQYTLTAIDKALHESNHGFHYTQLPEMHGNQEGI